MPAKITGAEPWMIVSDLDGTLLGDDRALEKFADWVNSHDGRLHLVYSSGRFCDSIRESIDSTDLPEPAATIGGVGSDIVLLPQQETLRAWHDRIRDGWDARKVHELVLAESDIEAQPDTAQSDFKQSFYLFDAPPARITALDEKLRNAGLAVDIIYSSNRDLDVLPAGCNKGTSAAFLADYFEIPRTRVIACGDSGNDARMMEQDFLGVIVANAQPELRAVDGPNIFHAAAPCASGVLEGLRFWAPDFFPPA